MRVEAVGVDPLCISIAARSGTGKTSFLEKLIPQLTARGYRVGVIKHTHHALDIDRPGKDSFRLREAGAAQVVVNAPNQFALLRRQERELPLGQVLTYFRDVELVLVEGYKQEDLPRIEIFRSDAGHAEPLFRTGPAPLALVTDRAFGPLPFPVFTLEDVRGVADLIEEQFLKKR